MVNLSPEAIKHFVHGDELAAPQIPMCLLRQQGEIDRIGQACVEQRRYSGLGVGFQIVSGLVKLHGSTRSEVVQRQSLSVVVRNLVEC